MIGRKRSKSVGGETLALLAGLGGWGLLRLAELGLSARHERRLAHMGIARAEERGFPWLVAAHTAPFVLAPVEILALRSRGGRRVLPGWLRGSAAALLGGSLLLRAWTIKTLGVSWNVHVHGGSLMPVTDRGPYRFVRHPNYVAAFLELLALPLCADAPITAVLASALNAFALRRRVTDEEAVLSRSPAWRHMMEHKPRFIPWTHPPGRNGHGRD